MIQPCILPRMNGEVQFLASPRMVNMTRLDVLCGLRAAVQDFEAARRFKGLSAETAMRLRACSRGELAFVCETGIGHVTVRKKRGSYQAESP